MAIACKTISFDYDGRPLLDGVSFQLKAGTIGALIGPSGEGKSTLFQILVGLLKPKGGVALLSGKTSYLMQEEVLLPWRTVLENVVLSAELQGRDARDEALELLSEFGLQEWADRYPDELSGGMKQRAALAESLVSKAPILLLDEPFSSLDAALRQELLGFLKEWQKRHQMTVLLITHDFHDALSLADEIFLLKGGKISRVWEIKDAMRGDSALMWQTSLEMQRALSGRG